MSLWSVVHSLRPCSSRVRCWNSVACSAPANAASCSFLFLWHEILWFASAPELRHTSGQPVQGKDAKAPAPASVIGSYITFGRAHILPPTGIDPRNHEIARKKRMAKVDSLSALIHLVSPFCTNSNTALVARSIPAPRRPSFRSGLRGPRKVHVKFDT